MIVRTLKNAEPELLEKVYNYLATTGGAAGTDITKDGFVVALEGGEVRGVFAYRPCVYLHEFRTAHSSLPRATAEALINYALGLGFGLGYHTAIMLIDDANAPMLRFVDDKGAVVVSNGHDHTLRLDIK